MEQWITVCRADELQPGEGRTVTVQGQSLAIFRRENGEIHAIGDECPHAYASLGEGILLDDVIVVCPAHGWAFDVRTGFCEGDTTIRVPSYGIREHDGEIQVHL